MFVSSPVTTMFKVNWEISQCLKDIKSPKKIDNYVLLSKGNITSTNDQCVNRWHKERFICIRITLPPYCHEHMSLLAESPL